MPNTIGGSRGTGWPGALPSAENASVREPVLGIVPSWEAVVRVHWQQVFRHALRLAGNRQDAEDLAQDTFLRAYRARSTYKPGNFEGWLHRITTNLFLSGVRRAKGIKIHVRSDEALAVLPSSGHTPAEILDDRMLDPEILRALQALSPPFRAAVVLSDVAGLPYGEIACILDVKVGTVRSRLHRGRALLRAALSHRNRRTTSKRRNPPTRQTA